MYVCMFIYCERSELLIRQVHQCELGCIKLHTPYRYEVPPKLYPDWLMCTVFYRVEFLNTFQHRVDVKKSKARRRRQKAATVLPNRTAAA